jgi:plasmid stability protein
MEEEWRVHGHPQVKRLWDALYRKLRARAKRERRSVAQEVTVLLAQVRETPASRSTLELHGLGKELWRGVDAGSHVRKGRRGLALIDDLGAGRSALQFAASLASRGSAFVTNDRHLPAARQRKS